METVSIREAAERLNVTPKVVRRLVAQGIIPASKAAGPHGEEWRLEAAAVMAQRGAPARAARAVPGPLATPPETHAGRALTEPPVRPAPSRRDDTASEHVRFLQQHVERLTAILDSALARHTPSAPAAAVPEIPDAVLPPPDDMISTVTQALQSSLRGFEGEGIRLLEMGSVRVLWGRPVLWRVAAEAPADVAALLNAILSPGARWDPPGEEVHFVWARDGAGAAVWGTACGAGWFGPTFQEALRSAQVERC